MMAESRGSLIAKSVQKHAGRAKEKILQNLGKVDRTADEIFDEHLQNFTKQQNAANKLQKEFNNYIRCIRAAQTASKSFLEAVNEVYETNWTGHDLLYVQTQSVDMLYQDYSHKLGEQVLLPLNTYQSQFPEMKKKIDKRGRKLVDYDAQRHNYQTLQSSMAKKRDDAKLTRGRELLEEAKRTYEILNSELHDELPALHDSRILFLVTNLQTLFNTEQVFHAETAKVYSELEAIVDRLATDSQRTSYSIKRTNGASLPRKIINDNNTIGLNSISSSPIKNNIPQDNQSSPTTPTQPPTPITTTTTTTTTTNIPSSPPDLHTPSSTTTNPLTTSSSSSTTSTAAVTPPPPQQPPPIITTTVTNNNASLNSSSTPPPSPAATLEITQPVNLTPPTTNTTLTDGVVTKSEVNGNVTTTNSDDTATDDNDLKLEQSNKSTSGGGGGGKPVVEELYDIPVGASTENLPPGVLYRVKATYKYTREDVDELSFDVGETIQVVEYDDPEEQEEGWLMGIVEKNGDKGMFPANFTKPL